MSEPTKLNAPMIATRDLARTFKTRGGVVEAVRGVDLRVEAGEIFGFLGPNGAGKTTSLRMLATLMAPTAGEATVAGATFVANRRRCGDGSDMSHRAARPTRPRPGAASS